MPGATFDWDWDWEERGTGRRDSDGAVGLGMPLDLPLPPALFDMGPEPEVVTDLSSALSSAIFLPRAHKRRYAIVIS